jgi:hypothetical protein
MVHQPPKLAKPSNRDNGRGLLEGAARWTEAVASIGAVLGALNALSNIDKPDIALS